MLYAFHFESQDVSKSYILKITKLSSLIRQSAFCSLNCENKEHPRALVSVNYSDVQVSVAETVHKCFMHCFLLIFQWLVYICWALFFETTLICTTGVLYLQHRRQLAVQPMLHQVQQPTRICLTTCGNVKTFCRHYSSWRRTSLQQLFKMLKRLSKALWLVSCFSYSQILVLPCMSHGCLVIVCHT